MLCNALSIDVSLIATEDARAVTHQQSWSFLYQEPLKLISVSLLHSWGRGTMQENNPAFSLAFDEVGSPGFDSLSLVYVRHCEK